jgi:hypothetical protein
MLRLGDRQLRGILPDFTTTFMIAPLLERLVN